MPEDVDFEFGDPDQPSHDRAPTRGDGRADPNLEFRVAHPVRLNGVGMTRNGFNITIRFPCANGTTCIAGYREQLLNLIEAPECSVVIFDLTGMDVPPSGMLGLFATAVEQGCEVELCNPSPAVLETLRIAKLDTFLLVRGTT